MIIFTPQNITLLVASLINLAMSIFVFSRGAKNKINLYFGLLTFFVFLWGLGLFLARVIETDFWLFWVRLVYPAALGIAVSLFYFCDSWPFRHNKINNTVHIFILIPAIFLSAIAFIKDLFIVSYTKNNLLTEFTLVYYNPTYILYAVYFIVVVILAIILLLKKYNDSEGIFKKQIFVLVLAIIIGLVFGSYFDLFTCYFGNFEYEWAGPVATVLMNLVVFSFIIVPKEKIHG